MKLEEQLSNEVCSQIQRLKQTGLAYELGDQ
jgi:hypothetical protein